MNFRPSHDFLDCLGWALLHFIWQGLIIAGLLGGTLWLLRRRSANLRYLAGCFALLLLAVAPVVTFQSLQRPDREPLSLRFTQTISSEVIAEKNLPPSFAPQTHSVVIPHPPVHEFNFSDILETALPWFVAAWSLGVLILSCRLFTGWLVIQKLRRSATTALIEPWQPKLKELARRVGVSRPVRLLQSACVEVPAVIGWLRPVILLPASCLAGLTPAQLESILAHELAHIRRHDYLVNLLQNLVETLLFYHPAVWWVSRRIRAEREHCCDDLAVKICGDAATYARALATLEELRPAPAQLALAAGGAPLLERIRRLAGQTERPPARPAWPVAGVIAILLLALIVAGLRNNPAQAALPATSPIIASQSTTPTVSTNPILPTRPIDSPAPAVESKIVAAASPAAPVPPPTAPPAPAKEEPLPQINIKTKWVEADAAKVGTNILVESLGLAESQNLKTFSGKFGFMEYLIVGATSSAQSNQYIFVHDRVDDCPLGTQLSEPQYQSLIKILEQRDGVDILTAPEVTTESGRPCQLQAVDLTNMVVGGEVPGQTDIAHNIAAIPFGQVIDLIPHVLPDHRTIDLTITGTVTEFVGYEDPATVTNQSGKRLPKNWAIPHLRQRQFTAHVSVPDGQTLVLGGPPVPITQQKKTKRTFLGRLFHSAKSDVDTVDKTLLLLITPTLIKPDGRRYHSAAPTSKGRQAILSKLDLMRADTVAYDHVPLREVINDLSVRSKSLDTNKQGINFLIAREAPASISAVTPGTIDPATGLLVIPPLPNAPTNAGDIIIDISPPLKNLRLVDVLDAIIKASDVPIRYSILDYAVVFSLRNPNESPTLEIRTFHVNPRGFREALENFGYPPPSEIPSATNQVGLKFVTGSNSTDNLQVAVRKFFNNLSVDFSTNNPANLGKAFAWGDRRGVLTVRATTNDLDRIGAAIESLNLSAPRINLKVKFAEITQQDDRALGFNWTPGINGPDPVAGAAPPLTNVAIAAPAGMRTPVNAPTIGNLSAILTPAQYKAALQAMETRGGVQLLDAPEVTIESGRQTQVQGRELQTNRALRLAGIQNGVNSAIVNQVFSRTLLSQPVLDLIPYLLSDDFSIQMTAIATVTEFVGMDDPKPLKTDMEGKPLAGANPGLTLPHFRLRQSTSVATISDGNTYVFNVILPAMPAAATDQTRKKDSATAAKKNLMIFITPTIVNPDGTPYHTAQRIGLFQTNALAPVK